MGGLCQRQGPARVVADARRTDAHLPRDKDGFDAAEAATRGYGRHRQDVRHRGLLRHGCGERGVERIKVDRTGRAH